MEFLSPTVRKSTVVSERRKRRASSAKVSIDQPWSEKVFGHNLQLYSIPPADSISLLEFEELAIDRLKLLKSVEYVGEKFPKTSQEYASALTTELHKNNFKIALHGTDVSVKEEAGENESLFEQRRKDHLSHFILRLAFCRTPDSRQWFLQQELDLFRFRFGNESRDSINEFLRINGFGYKMVDGKSLDPETVNCVADSCATDISCQFVEMSDICLAPFVDALDLVKNRKVFLKDGTAYVLRNDLCVLVAGKFRSCLSKALVVASKYFGFIQEENRLVPVLKRLSNKAYLGKDYSNADHSGKTVTPEMIPSLAKTSFPLCMRALQSELQNKHHLKHGGRQQYGLFLKGIGLSLEDALRFWKDEFTKIMDGEKFHKLYAYNIRHNYGKEGKRVDYTPYSCTKIILSNPPGPGDAHGCPFRHTDPKLLKEKLQDLKLSPENASKITGLAQAGRYDQACSRFFEITHLIPENSIGQIIAHPNQYFEESRKILTGKGKEEYKSLRPQQASQDEGTGHVSQSVPWSSS